MMLNTDTTWMTNPARPADVKTLLPPLAERK